MFLLFCLKALKQERNNNAFIVVENQCCCCCCCCCLFTALFTMKSSFSLDLEEILVIGGKVGFTQFRENRNMNFPHILLCPWKCQVKSLLVKHQRQV